MTTFCEWNDESWGPNEGCHESLSAPEEHPCRRPATHLVQFVEGDGVLPYLVCLDHAVAILGDRPQPDGTPADFTDQVYRHTDYGSIECNPWEGRPIVQPDAHEVALAAERHWEHQTEAKNR